MAVPKKVKKEKSVIMNNNGRASMRGHIIATSSTTALNLSVVAQHPIPISAMHHTRRRAKLPQLKGPSSECKSNGDRSSRPSPSRQALLLRKLGPGPARPAQKLGPASPVRPVGPVWLRRFWPQNPHFLKFAYIFFHLITSLS
jgi:hypothetical protein